jgi:hypothetical protein
MASATMVYNQTTSNCSNKRGLDTLDDVGSDDEEVVTSELVIFKKDHQNIFH